MVLALDVKIELGARVGIVRRKNGRSVVETAEAETGVVAKIKNVKYDEKVIAGKGIESDCPLSLIALLLAIQ